MAAPLPDFGLPPALVRRLDERGARRHLEAGTSLFHAGDRSAEVYLLASGLVKIWVVGQNGHQTVLGVRERGDLIGELAALDGSPRSATGTCLTPVDLLVVPSAVFVHEVTTDPKGALRLLRMLAERLRDADAKRTEHGARDATGRVAGRLAELAVRFGRPGEGGVHIDLALSQDDLAGYVGASREAVAKALRVLRDQGLVLTGRRSFVVVDVERLRSLSEAGRRV